MKFFSAIVVSLLISVSALAEGDKGKGTTNVRFSPIGLLIGLINVEVDFKVNENWTMGPTLAFWNFSVGETGSNLFGTDVSFFSLGGRANWYKNGIHTDGLYVGPSLSYNTVKLKSGSDSASASGLVASGLVGYGWFWESFNMHLGGGLSLPLGSLKAEVNGEEYAARGGSAGLAIEYTLGWTF